MDNLLKPYKNYLTKLKKKPSKITLKNYLSDVRKFLNWNNHPSLLFKNPSSLLSGYNQYLIKINTPEKSLKRYQSSLNKFFEFLREEKLININPYLQKLSSQEIEKDKFLINKYKIYLISNKLSKISIKNYLNDINQFTDWLNNLSDIKTLNDIHLSTVIEYKNRLKNNLSLSEASINRKLSSIRQYLNWINTNSENIDKIINKKQNKTTYINNLHRLNSPILNKDEDRDAKKLSENSKLNNLNNTDIVNIDDKNLYINIIDSIIYPFLSIIEKLQYLNWKIRGKKIFSSKPNLSHEKKKIDHLKVNTEQIKNIPKSFYAPLEISLKGLPKHKIFYHHLRHTRPKWYKIYHSYQITNSIHLGILVIFCSIFGYLIYNALYSPNTQKLTIASELSTPQKTLLFKGTIKDEKNDPITIQSPLRFSIYNDQYTSRSALLWQEVQNIKPDQNGNFEVNLGLNNPNLTNILTSSPKLFLGIAVKNNPELKPRQEISTASLSSNSKKLQGLVPITHKGAGTENVILALDSAGNLTIGENANPIFEATGGLFTISGKTLLLNTLSDGDIDISPDGLGKINLNKPLQNITNNNNISIAQGAVEIDDIFAILATSSGQSAFTISQNSTGPLIIASTSGSAKFSLENDGSAYFAGKIKIDGNSLDSTSNSFSLLSTKTVNLDLAVNSTSIKVGSSSGSTQINNTIIARGGLTVSPGRSLIISGNIASNVIPFTSSTYDLGNSEFHFRNAYIDNIYTTGKTSAFGFWQRENGYLSTINNESLSIGNNSTSAASFKILASGTYIGTASTSGQLTFIKNSQINLLNNSSLGFYNSVAADDTININSPALFIQKNGNIGISTNNPGAKLDIKGELKTEKLTINGTQNNSPIAVISGSTTQAGLIIDNSGTGTIFAASSSGQNRFVISQNGNIGIGDQSPQNTLKINGSLCVNNTTGQCAGSNAGTIYASNTSLQSADVAENYISSQQLEAGDIIMPEGKDDYTAVIRTSKSYEAKALGVVSKKPGITLNSEAKTDDAHPYILPIALSGRTPVKITSINGPIKAGDYITTSEIPGVGMKATSPGIVLGKALEDYSESNQQKIGIINMFINLSNLDNTYFIGQKNEYNNLDNNQSLIKSIINLANSIIYNINTGYTETQKITSSTIGITSKNLKQNLESLTYSLEQTTNTRDSLSNKNNQNQKFLNPLGDLISSTPTPTQISPITANSNYEHIASREAVLEASRSANISLSNPIISTQSGNIATISSITQNSYITSSDSASIPTIQELSLNQYIEDLAINPNLNYANIASLSTNFIYDPENKTNPVNFPHGIASYSNSYFSDISLSGQLNIGASLIIKDNSLNTIGQDLKIQNLRQGNLSIMNGLVTLDTKGNLKVFGNATFAKDVSIHGKLQANYIAPIPDEDMIISLNSQKSPVEKSNLIINNSSGSVILKINQKGDLAASGSGSFTKLITNRLNIIRGVQADTSLTETMASSSAGTATIIAHEKERTIKTPFLSSDSLIYLTPTSDTQGLTPYIARQTENSFTISLPYAINKNININWWIVN